METSVHEWWAQARQSLPDSVRGLWFGLADLVDQSGQVVRTMYVSGSDTFSATDGGDWAADPTWEPEPRYCVIAEIAALPLDDWAKAETLAVAIVRELQPQTASAAVEGVATGFDGGEAIITWQR